MRILLLCLTLFSVIALPGQVVFENVSNSSGLTYQGRSWGSSWGDINGDGFMDLFMSCHQNESEPYFDNDTIRILVNLGGLLFDDSIYSLDHAGQSDFHGGVFFDQDNDGDKDLFIVTGGLRDEVFLRNDGGTSLQDRADELNLIFFNARGRQTTCLDVNNDGLTDLIINNGRVTSPSGGLGSVLMLADQALGFTLDSTLGFNVPSSRISLISDLDGDGRTDLCVVTRDTLKLFSFTQGGNFVEKAALAVSNITDICIADFNGDLLPDIFVARNRLRETDIQLFNDSTIHSSSNVSPNIPPSMTNFKTEGSLEIIISTEFFSPYSLHIGNGSVVNNVQGKQTFTLTPSQAQGFQNPLSFPGGVKCSFGFLPDSTWHIEVTKTNAGLDGVILEVKSSSPITNLTTSGMPELDSSVRDVLLLNQGNFQFTPSTSPAFMVDDYSANVTCGDLDNDMDIDIFVVSTGRAKNRITRLYENLGNGEFLVHENGWGTKGDVAGIGDAVTIADYNNDGFLDLFVTNGSTNNFVDSAGVDLYKNQGNENNWIKLVLNGVQSNADGFGARVILQANGVSQVRDMTGGIHLHSQDDARLHFGLGSADSVDVITVYWPSGVVDVLQNLNAGEILTIVEGEYGQIDCLGVLAGTANIGTFCDDGDPCTSDDRYNADCNCVGTFIDSDNDGICDAYDLCPTGPEPGTICDDGDTATINDVIGEDCICAGTPLVTCPEETLLLTFTLDNFGSQTTWVLVNVNGALLGSGGPYTDGIAGSTISEQLCVPTGCYRLRVFDSNGDGITGGGYILADGFGERIIDANGAFGSVSFAETIFCVPIGESSLIPDDCDQGNIGANQTIMTNPVAGAMKYQFFIFDPHGTYKRTFNRATEVLGAYRLATLPKNLELNVRVRALGPGLITEYGPTCTITATENATFNFEDAIGLIEEEQNFLIWPNPSDGSQVNVLLQGLDAGLETAEVTVYNALGSQVVSLVVPAAGGGLNTVLDLRGIADGMYLIKVSAGNTIYSRRLLTHQGGR